MVMRLGFMVIAVLVTSNVGAQAKRVELVTEDNISLHATYYPAKTKGPALLMLNMCNPGMNQFAWEPLAIRMSDVGFHVLTFDYRGFGESGGELPTGLRSIAEAMPYWKENWMSDVTLAYDTLLSKPLVDGSRVAVAGASCGVFLGTELALSKNEIKTLVLFGGPTSKDQHRRLAERDNLPILLMTGDQRGPNESEGTLEWSDNVFNASQDERTRLIKYKSPVYGTMVLTEHPETLALAEKWLTKMTSAEELSLAGR